MQKPQDHFYITTPIYYVNASPHIGHAYTSLAADIRARFERMRGAQVNFLTGTDEHGQKIARAAEKRGMTPEQYSDEISQTYRNLSSTLGISNTDFIRTTEDRHIKGAQQFWLKAFQSGDIYKKIYRGLYCVGCEQFYIEKDLLPGRICPMHKTPTEELEEENYFFRLSAYRDRLRDHFEAHQDFIYPRHRFNEMAAILDHGLEDVSVSRSRATLSWGIPVPNDPDQVMYVWFDALTNYVTAIGFGINEAFFNNWWPVDAHIMAKEINRFHSLLWPAMLMSSGIELPRRIVVHGWLTVDGQKMSKSIGNVVDPFTLAREYPRDLFRYFLFREIRFGEDGDFSIAKMRERYRADLQHDLGNLLQRAIAMTVRYCDGRVPVRTRGNYQEQWALYERHMEQWEYQEALQVVFDYVRALNQLIDREKPWELMKAGKRKETESVLYNVLEGLRCIAVALSPFMPYTAANMLKALNFDYVEIEMRELHEWGLMKTGAQLSVPPILFSELT